MRNLLMVKMPLPVPGSQNAGNDQNDEENMEHRMLPEKRFELLLPGNHAGCGIA
ncbi:hypothetical protein D3C87_2202760 [compost metagenome]